MMKKIFKKCIIHELHEETRFFNEIDYIEEYVDV